MHLARIPTGKKGKTFTEGGFSSGHGKERKYDKLISTEGCYSAGRDTGKEKDEQLCLGGGLT